MQKNKIPYSDIQVLIRLFLKRPTSIHLFDPYGLVEKDEPIKVFESSDERKVLVNLSNNPNVFQKVDLNSFELIIDFKNVIPAVQEYHKQFNYIKNPEGQIRWMFQGNRVNEVLPFYNNSGLRGKLISNAIKSAAALKLGGLLADGKINIMAKSTPKIEETVSTCGDHYSLFLGTPGAQRSIILAAYEGKKLNRFVKVPVLEEAKKLIVSEIGALQTVKEMEMESVVLPRFEVDLNLYALISENLNTADRKKKKNFTYAHAEVIAEFFKQSYQFTTISELELWKQTKAKLQKLRLTKNDQILSLSKLCFKLMEGIDDNEEVVTHMAHGDFTPWNIFAEKEKLALYDWEMAKSQAPAFYDLFHFYYQKGILMDRSTLAEARKEITSAFEFWPIATLMQEFNLEKEIYHKLYLVTAITYFLDVFSRQALTIQNQWQLDSWRKALKHELFKLDQKSGVNCRKAFLTDFNKELVGFSHAFLKFDYPSLQELPEKSDVDIAIEERAIPEVLEFIKNYPTVNRYKVTSKSFMKTVEIHFDDASFLSIDMLFKFQRKELTMFNSGELLNRAKRSEKGVVVPDFKDDLAYTLGFYVLNGINIPRRYICHFIQATVSEKQEALKFINQLYGTSYKSFMEMMSQGLSQRKTIIATLRKKSCLLKGYCNYLMDTLKSFRFTNGFIVTFSGVDGVGKSTIIQLVKTNIETTYRKEVVLLRHRPGLLPILSSIKHGKEKAEEIASVTIPRKGENHSRLSSLLRFAYYFSDYFFGQLYVYLRYVLRGKVVLYDRYYFDFINDAKRSNIELDPMIVKALYRFVMKPRLNVFLYADPDVILKRKQELNAQDIKNLNERYHALFDEFERNSLTSTYRTVENLDLNLTINHILREFGRVA